MDLIIFTIISVIFLFMLFLTFQYKNVAFGGFSIILCLFLGLAFINGIQYTTGSTITELGGNYIISDTSTTYSNAYLSTTFFIICLYLITQIISIRKINKKEKEESTE